MKLRHKITCSAFFICCAVSYGFGMETRQPPKIVTREVFVYVNRPYAPPVKATRYFDAQRDKLAAALPASVLVASKKHALEVAGK